MKFLGAEKTDQYGITDEYWLRPDGKITVRRVQDVDPIFEENRLELNSHSAKGKLNTGGEGLGTKVARIPNGLIEELIQTHGVNLLTCDEATLHKFINDSNYSNIRTAHGRV